MEGESQEALDPRIQIELEKLNKTSEEINNLELDLDRCRSLFRQILTDSTQQLNGLAKKLGSCIDKARPYYEARVKARQAQIKTQDAALRFERACGQLMAAKEMVTLAEEGFFNKGQPFDPAWQEMLNHATVKVNEAEKEKLESECAHMETAGAFNEIDQHVKALQKDLKRSINKSRPYFDQKARFSKAMEEQKNKVDRLERHVTEAKRRYAETLRSLEQISAEIHHQRGEARVRREMGGRGSGVGAECPEPPSVVERRNMEFAGKQESKPDIPVKDRSLISPEAAISLEKEHGKENINVKPIQDPSKNTTSSPETVYTISSPSLDSKTSSNPVNVNSSNSEEAIPSPVQENSKPPSRLKRVVSYEEAVGSGVTEATQHDLLKVKQRGSSQDSGDLSQGQIKKKSLSERLFGGILGNHNNNGHHDGNDGKAAAESVRVISEKVVESSGDSQLSDRNSGVTFTVGGETQSNIPEPKPSLPSHFIKTTSEKSKSTTLRLQVSGDGIPPKALPEILTPDEDQVTQLNSEVMDSLQRSKSKSGEVKAMPTNDNQVTKMMPEATASVMPRHSSKEVVTIPMDENHITKVNSEVMASFLPSRSSRDQLLLPEETGAAAGCSDSDSITGSLSSMNLLDDEQIQDIMVGFQEMEEYAEKFENESERERWKEMPLAARLSYSEGFVDVEKWKRGDGDREKKEGEKKSADDFQLTVVSQISQNNESHGKTQQDTDHSEDVVQSRDVKSSSEGTRREGKLGHDEKKIINQLEEMDGHEESVKLEVGPMPTRDVFLYEKRGETKNPSEDSDLKQESCHLEEINGTSSGTLANRPENGNDYPRESSIQKPDLKQEAYQQIENKGAVSKRLGHKLEVGNDNDPDHGYNAEDESTHL